MQYFFRICFLFFFGGIVGWILELLFRRAVHGKWINPGFLVGPYLPLYGSGLILLYFISNFDYSFIGNEIWRSVFVILIITFSMTLLEYITGLIFIKGLKVKLWDYSGSWGNVQGIICPLFTLIWGVIGAVYYLLLNEDIVNIVGSALTNSGALFVLGMVFGVFLLDNVYSFQIVSKIRKWAKDNNVIIKYENLKLSIKVRAKEMRRKAHFVFPFKSKDGLAKELENFSVRQKNEIGEKDESSYKNNEADRKI